MINRTSSSPQQALKAAKSAPNLLGGAGRRLNRQNTFQKILTHGLPEAQAYNRGKRGSTVLPQAYNHEQAPKNKAQMALQGSLVFIRLALFFIMLAIVIEVPVTLPVVKTDFEIHYTIRVAVIALTSTGTLLFSYHSAWENFWQQAWSVCICVVISAWLTLFWVTDTPPTSLPSVVMAALLVVYGAPGLPVSVSIVGSFLLTGLSAYFLVANASDNALASVALASASASASASHSGNTRKIALAMAEFLPLVMVNVLGLSVQSRLHNFMDSLLTCTELNAQVNRLVVVLENMDGTMATTIDRFGKFMFVTASSQAMVGHAPGEMVGSCFLNYVHPDDQNAVESALEGYRLDMVEKKRRLEAIRARLQSGSTSPMERLFQQAKTTSTTFASRVVARSPAISPTDSDGDIGSGCGNFCVSPAKLTDNMKVLSTADQSGSGSGSGPGPGPGPHAPSPSATLSIDDLELDDGWKFSKHETLRFQMRKKDASYIWVEMKQSKSNLGGSRARGGTPEQFEHNKMKFDKMVLHSHHAGSDDVSVLTQSSLALGLGPAMHTAAQAGHGHGHSYDARKSKKSKLHWMEEAFLVSSIQQINSGVTVLIFTEVTDQVEQDMKKLEIELSPKLKEEQKRRIRPFKFKNSDVESSLKITRAQISRKGSFRRQESQSSILQPVDENAVTGGGAERGGVIVGGTGGSGSGGSGEGQSQSELPNTLFDTVRLPIIACNNKGQVRYWNRECAAITGYSQAEAQGHSLLDFVSPEYRALAARMMTMATGTTKQAPPTSLTGTPGTAGFSTGLNNGTLSTRKRAHKKKAQEDEAKIIAERRRTTELVIPPFLDQHRASQQQSPQLAIDSREGSLQHNFLKEYQGGKNSGEINRSTLMSPKHARDMSAKARFQTPRNNDANTNTSTNISREKNNKINNPMGGEMKGPPTSSLPSAPSAASAPLDKSKAKSGKVVPDTSASSSSAAAEASAHDSVESVTTMNLERRERESGNDGSGVTGTGTGTGTVGTGAGGEAAPQQVSNFELTLITKLGAAVDIVLNVTPWTEDNSSNTDSQDSTRGEGGQTGFVAVGHVLDAHFGRAYRLLAGNASEVMKWAKGDRGEKGAFGRVVLARRMADNVMVAIKKVDLTGMDRAVKRKVAAEGLLLQSISHPNIVCCYDTFTESNELHIVMEYADGGNIRQKVLKQKKFRDEEDRKMMERREMDAYNRSVEAALATKEKKAAAAAAAEGAGGEPKPQQQPVKKLTAFQRLQLAVQEEDRARQAAARAKEQEKRAQQKAQEEEEAEAAAVDLNGCPIQWGFQCDQILSWFAQLAVAVKHLHDLKIIHRDLKAMNVMLSSNGYIKLCDFGHARKFDGGVNGTDAKTMSTCGTPETMSPEMVMGWAYGFQHDVWAIGCILYELITLVRPFDGPTVHDMLAKVCRADYPALTRGVPTGMKNLIESIFILKPEDRPLIGAVCTHPVVEAAIAKHTRDRLFPRARPLSVLMAKGGSKMRSSKAKLNTQRNNNGGNINGKSNGKHDRLDLLNANANATPTKQNLLPPVVRARQQQQQQQQQQQHAGAGVGADGQDGKGDATTEATTPLEGNEVASSNRPGYVSVAWGDKKAVSPKNMNKTHTFAVGTRSSKNRRMVTQVED